LSVGDFTRRLRLRSSEGLRAVIPAKRCPARNTRAQIRTNAMMYDGLWDAMYFLLLIGFSIGNLSTPAR